MKSNCSSDVHAHRQKHFQNKTCSDDDDDDDDDSNDDDNAIVLSRGKKI